MELITFQTEHMHYADINAALHKAKLKPSQLARKLNVPHSNVSGVIHGTAKSRRIAQAIATATGKTLDELWPGAYPAQPPKSSKRRRALKAA